VVYWETLAESLYAIGVQFDRVVDRAELDRQSGVQTDQGNVLLRLTQAFARPWRAAS